MDGKLRNMTSVYLTGERGILCLYRIGSRVVSDKYVGSAGGHFEQNELNDARACALRELNEELKRKGFITISGRINREYFNERLYEARKENKNACL